METRPDLPAKLKELRKKNPKLSQAQAAEISGVSDRMWFAYEKGEAEPKLDALTRYAANRGISLNELLTGEKDSPHELPWEIDIPVLDDRIFAGPATQGFGESVPTTWVRANVKNPKAFGLLVHGTSMHPEIQEGDIVILAESSDVISGKLYAAIIDDGPATLKRIYKSPSGEYRLQPTNPEAKIEIIHADRLLKVYRVLQILRDLQ